MDTAKSEFSGFDESKSLHRTHLAMGKTRMFSASKPFQEKVKTLLTFPRNIARRCLKRFGIEMDQMNLWTGVCQWLPTQYPFPLASVRWSDKLRNDAWKGKSASWSPWLSCEVACLCACLLLLRVSFPILIYRNYQWLSKPRYHPYYSPILIPVYLTEHFTRRI